MEEDITRTRYPQVLKTIRWFILPMQSKKDDVANETTCEAKLITRSRISFYSQSRTYSDVNTVKIFDSMNACLS